MRIWEAQKHMNLRIRIWIPNTDSCFFKATASQAAAAGGVRPAAAEPSRLHLGGGPVPGQPARGGGDLPLPGGGATGSHTQGREVRQPYKIFIFLQVHIPSLWHIPILFFLSGTGSNPLFHLILSDFNAYTDLHFSQVRTWI
jgi:hypothetical protein